MFTVYSHNCQSLQAIIPSRHGRRSAVLSPQSNIRGNTNQSHMNTDNNFANDIAQRERIAHEISTLFDALYEDENNVNNAARNNTGSAVYRADDEPTNGDGNSNFTNEENVSRRGSTPGMHFFQMFSGLSTLLPSFFP